MERYLHVLMLTDHQNCKGFPPEVAAEIFNLSVHYGRLFPCSGAAPDRWSGAPGVHRRDGSPDSGKDR